jgi:hypothetical protein
MDRSIARVEICADEAEEEEHVAPDLRATLRATRAPTVDHT